MILFKNKFDQNNTSKRNKLPESLKNFLGERAPKPIYLYC